MIKFLQKEKRLLKAARTPFMLVALALMAFSGFAQQSIVSGTVTDKGGPLPGVSIVEKGTSNGTTTDAGGKFTMTASSANSILVFSIIGYKTKEQTVNNQTVIDLELEEDATELNEIVVTALGVQKEVKSLGYAVQKVEGNTIQKAREPNIFSSLTGKVAGLEIKNQTDLFQDPEISLRGEKPLIVVDGVPMVNVDLWKVNADDIESFTVLKGANASALYGAIGRYGAIMITTKRGSQQKTTVEVNSSTMFQTSFIRIPEVQTTYGNGYNGQYAYVDGSGGGTEGGGWIWGPKLNQRDDSTPSGYWETTQFDSPIDPATGDRIPTPFLSRGADNVTNFFRTGILSTNNISISSGNESGNFRVSISNNYQRGIVPNSQLNNTSFGVSGGYNLLKRLTADASITYNRQHTDNFPETGYGPTNYLYNLVLWTGPDIDVNNLRDYWEKDQEGVQQRHFNKSWYNNPYFQAYEYLRGYYKDNMLGQLKLNYTIAPGLELLFRSGINQYGLNRTWKEPKSYVGYDNFSRGNFDIQNESNFNINTDFLAQYNKALHSNINLRVSLGSASRWNTYRKENIETDGLSAPGLFNVSNSSNPLRGSNSLEEEKVNSLFGTIDLELFNGIFLGFTGRNDWISTLPLENNSFFYPSVSLAGVITDFVDLNRYKISFLKVRSSWSKVTDGRIVLSGRETYPYNHISTYDPGVNWNGNPSLEASSTLITSNLSPQSSETIEAGLDLRLFEGKIGVDAAVYQIRDYNNLFEQEMSNSSGYPKRLINGAEFLRKGFEVTLSATPVKTSELAWNIVVNYSRYRKYLNKTIDGASQLENVKPGERWDQLFSTTYQRSAGGELIIGTNGFPVVDPFQRMMGYSGADFIFGVNNNVSYKNFVLGVSFDGRVGGVMYSTTNQKMWWGGTHPGTVNQYRDDANNGVASYIAPGLVVTEGSIEYDSEGKTISDTRIYAPNSTPVNYISWNINTSNAHLTHYYNQSFVKLREVTITYQLPQSILQKTFFSKASVGLVGRNLALWTNMPEVDPDSGEDNLQTPSTRNIGFNFNFTF